MSASGRKQGPAEFLFPVCVLGGLCLEEEALWLRGLYRPGSDTGRSNMAQKLHDKDLSDGQAIFSKDEGQISGDNLEFLPKKVRRVPGRVNGPSL